MPSQWSSSQNHTTPRDNDKELRGHGSMCQCLLATRNTATTQLLHLLLLGLFFCFGFGFFGLLYLAGNCTSYKLMQLVSRNQHIDTNGPLLSSNPLFPNLGQNPVLHDGFSTNSHMTTGLSTTGPSTTGISTTGPSTTGPITTGPSTTGPSTTDLSITVPTIADPSTTVALQQTAVLGHDVAGHDPTSTSTQSTNTDLIGDSVVQSAEAQAALSQAAARAAGAQPAPPIVNANCPPPELWWENFNVSALGDLSTGLQPAKQALDALLARKLDPEQVRRMYLRLLPELDFSKALSAEDPAQLQDFARQTFQFLKEGKHMKCTDDPTLLTAFKEKYIDGTPVKFLLASNLHMRDHIMPNFIVQLLQVLVVLPPGSVYVSIYASGSTDKLPFFLDLLKLFLVPVHIPFKIVSNGTMTRAKDQGRIQFLADVRNEAVLPFFNEHYNRTGGMGLSIDCFQPDSVLFINDIYYCKSDMMRVMMHSDADMACGVDLFWLYRVHIIRRAKKWDGASTDGGGKGDYVEEVIDEGAEPQHSRRLQGRMRKRRFRSSKTVTTSAAAAAAAATTAAVAAAPPPKKPAESNVETIRRVLKLLVFWDIWVARDMQGNKFNNRAPFVVDGMSKAAMMSGIPFPAYCCWNGMVRLNAEPFRRGLNFRAWKENECKASECSLLCDDFHRTGFGKVLVDPGVRVMYDAYDPAHHAWSTNQTAIPMTTWADATTAFPVLYPPLNYTKVECCLIDGEDKVDWKGCHFRDILKENFTRMHMQELYTQRQQSMAIAGPAA